MNFNLWRLIVAILWENIMAVKKSVRLSDHTIKACQSLSAYGDINWSGSINQIAERYSLFCEQNLPDLKQCEIYALVQAYNGYIYSNDVMLEIKSMDWQIAEAIQYDPNVVENLTSGDIDPVEFINRSKAWSIAERLAVLAKVQAFWNDNRPSYNDIDEDS